MSPRSKKQIEFHKRFKPPSSEQILNALRSGRKINKAKNATFENLLKHFEKLPKPVDELDWLAQFNESGQDCAAFENNSPIPSNKFIGHKKYIYYVEIGDFKETNLNFADLIEYSKCFFGENVIRVLENKIQIKFEEKELIASYGSKEKRLEFRYDKKSNRFQILAQSFHKLLKELKPKDSCGLIGFTEYDLYAEESDLFVAGLCNGRLGVGVFSCIRYEPRLKYSEEDWFKIKIVKGKRNNLQSNYTTLLTRSCKLLTHETCHLLGFGHCIYMNCSMNGSGHLEEDFRQTIFLCPVDLKKLMIVLDFNITERYSKMKKFFDNHQALEESKWIQKVLESKDL